MCIYVLVPATRDGMHKEMDGPAVYAPPFGPWKTAITKSPPLHCVESSEGDFSAPWLPTPMRAYVHMSEVLIAPYSTVRKNVLDQLVEFPAMVRLAPNVGSETAHMQGPFNPANILVVGRGAITRGNRYGTA